MVGGVSLAISERLDARPPVTKNATAIWPTANTRSGKLANGPPSTGTGCDRGKKNALPGVVEHTTMVASNYPATKNTALRRDPIRSSSQPQNAPARAAATLLQS